MGQTYPEPIDPLEVVPAFVRDVRFSGGAVGDDVSVSTAAVAYANNGAANGAAEDPDYAPKTQAERATMLGVEMAEDITTPRGWIDPLSPATEKPDDPTLASIAPTTGAAGVGVTITLTGTGFSRYSTVKTGGVLTPYVEYVDPETLKVRLDPRSTAGSIDISVIDHSVETAPQSFTFT